MITCILKNASEAVPGIRGMRADGRTENRLFWTVVRQMSSVLLVVINGGPRMFGPSVKT